MKIKLWMIGPLIIFVVSLIFASSIMYLIIVSPRIDYQIVGSRVAILSGDSGQTVEDSVLVWIDPRGNRISTINVSGTLYHNQFNDTTGRYDKIEIESLDGLSLKVGLNNSDVLYDIGSFKDNYTMVSLFKTDLLPTQNVTEIRFYFYYSFPSVTCHCQDVHYDYIFKPTFRFGYII